MTIVIQNIKRFAKEQKLSIRNLERNAGLGNGVVSKWGAGAEPGVYKLQKVAKALGVTINDLTGDSKSNRE